MLNSCKTCGLKLTESEGNECMFCRKKRLDEIARRIDSLNRKYVGKYDSRRIVKRIK